MPSTLALKRRIKSVKNVKQITKAMELTAAAKMHRAQMMVLGARPYSERMRQLVNDVGAGLHPLLEKRTLTKQLIILVSTDRGLAGGLNASLVREVLRFVKETKVPTEYIIVGKKGLSLVAKYGLSVLATFSDLPARPDSLSTRPISFLAKEHYLSGQTDRVYVAYNHFHSTLSQKPTVTHLLPINQSYEALDGIGDKLTTEVIFEPNVDELLATLLPRLVDQIFYQILLEATASEHAARMVAMRSATDNASDLLEDLDLTFNGIRQSSITAQMAEISASITALEG